jgi:hypothetical protein
LAPPSVASTVVKKVVQMALHWARHLVVQTVVQKAMLMADWMVGQTAVHWDLYWAAPMALHWALQMGEPMDVATVDQWARQLAPQTVA